MKYIPIGTEFLGFTKCYCSHEDTYLNISDEFVKKISEKAISENQFDRQDIWLINAGLGKTETFPEKSFRRVKNKINGEIFNHSPHSFSTPPDQFLNSMYGLPYLERTREKVEYLKNTPFGANGEFIIQNYHEEKKKYEGKSLLILGGGPSTIDIDFSNLSTDYIWASNNFFLNEKFSNIKLDGLAVTPYMDLLLNKKLINFLDKNPETRIFFETERGDHNKDWDSMHEFMIKYPEKSFLYGTRYRSKIGITPRQICLAIFLGFKEIYFLGFDGVRRANERHAFEGKKELPQWLKKFDRYGGLYTEGMQFIQYWNYILQLRNGEKSQYDFNLYNLAEGLDYNVSSEITQCLKLHS